MAVCVCVCVPIIQSKNTKSNNYQTTSTISTFYKLWFTFSIALDAIFSSSVRFLQNKYDGYVNNIAFLFFSECKNNTLDSSAHNFMYKTHSRSDSIFFRLSLYGSQSVLIYTAFSVRVVTIPFVGLQSFFDDMKRRSLNDLCHCMERCV